MHQVTGFLIQQHNCLMYSCVSNSSSRRVVATWLNGKPCSDCFSLEHYITLGAQCSFKIHNELQLALLGNIMSTINMDASIYDDHHKPTKRTCTTMDYMHQGWYKVRKAFCIFVWNREEKADGYEEIIQDKWFGEPHAWKYQISTLTSLLLV